MVHITSIVEDFMTPVPHTIGSEQPLIKATEMMDQHRCRHLPVKHGGKLVGIISKSDIQLGKLTGDPTKIRVEDVMTTDIFQVTPEATVRSIAEKIVEQHLSSVLVVRKTGELLGIFTWVDLAKAFLALEPLRS